MKALIGGAIGAAALGGALLLANTRSTSTAAQAYNPAMTVASTSALPQSGPLYVDCGNGRLVLIRPVAPGQQYSQVECAPSAAVIAPQAYAETPGYMVQASYPVAQPAVQERVVYRDRVVERPVTRTASRSSGRRVAYAPARTYEVKQGRSWKKSALIIGGSAAGGAGVGALLGGKGGAKKGAVVGGIGGLVYDLATRNK
jgi:hypothetical protein